MKDVPIDRCDAVPVPGKPNCFLLVDRVTGVAFDINKVINEAYEAGNFKDAKYAV